MERFTAHSTTFVGSSQFMGAHGSKSPCRSYYDRRHKGAGRIQQLRSLQMALPALDRLLPVIFLPPARFHLRGALVSEPRTLRCARTDHVAAGDSSGE